MAVKDNPVVRGIGRAGYAAGRFARDAAYTELMPKGLIDYRQGYSTTFPAAAVVRLCAKGAAVSILALKALYDISTGDGQTSSMIMDPAKYLAVDAFVDSFLFSMNRRRRGSLNDRNIQDSLEDQPATLAVEVPYRVAKGAVKAVKHIIKRKNV